MESICLTIFVYVQITPNNFTGWFTQNINIILIFHIIFIWSAKPNDLRAKNEALVPE